MLDYEQMATLEESIIKDVDQETLEHLAADITHLVAHSAVTAIHQSEKLVDKTSGEPMDYEQLAELEQTVIKDVDQETLKCLTSDLTHLIAHSIVTGIHQSEKLQEN